MKNIRKNDDDDERMGPPRKRTRSFVWNYYTRVKGTTRFSATCALCNLEVTRNTSSTSMLISHLQKKHNITSPRGGVECKSEPPSSPEQNVLANFDMNVVAPQPPPAEELDDSCEYASYESFHQTVQDLMKDPDKLKSSFMSEYEGGRAVVNNEIISALGRHEQFSATIVEINACPQRRFLNVGLNSATKSYFLGMIPVNDSDGCQVAALVEEKLNEFGLDFWTHLAGITTHSTAMMSVDDSEGPLHQLCLAHVIQLCVKDALYIENSEVKVEPAEIRVVIVFDNELDEEDEFDALKRKYVRLVSKVCRAVKLFENEHFYEYPRRWSNLLKTLKRFVDYTKDHAFAADEDFTAGELQSVEELLNALGPLQQLRACLTRPKVDLVRADKLFGFTLALLSRQNTQISALIRARLATRYLERRNCDLVHVMNFLSDLKYVEKERDHFGVAIEKDTIVGTISELVERLRVRGKTKIDFDVKKNIGLYMKKSKRPVLLDNLYKALLTIHPTTSESTSRASMKWLGLSERAALSDELLNALVFMRRQFYLDNNTNSD